MSTVAAPDRQEASVIEATVPIDQIQSPEQFHQQAVVGVTENLVAAGHEVDQEKVSAVTAAENIINEARRAHGADLIAEGTHDFARVAAQPFGGSERGDLVRPGSDIHLEPIRRVSKMADFWKKPMSIINFFFRRNKPT